MCGWVSARRVRAAKLTSSSLAKTGGTTPTRTAPPSARPTLSGSAQARARRTLSLSWGWAGSRRTQPMSSQNWACRRLAPRRTGRSSPPSRPTSSRPSRSRPRPARTSWPRCTSAAPRTASCSPCRRRRPRMSLASSASAASGHKASRPWPTSLSVRRVLRTRLLEEDAGTHTHTHTRARARSHSSLAAPRAQTKQTRQVPSACLTGRRSHPQCAPAPLARLPLARLPSARLPLARYPLARLPLARPVRDFPLRRPGAD